MCQKRPSAIIKSDLTTDFGRPICRKPTVSEMSSFIEQLESVLLSQQGIVAGLLFAAILYLACQLAIRACGKGA